jgi:hypothetical protein
MAELTNAVGDVAKALNAEQVRTAMKSPEHLARWLEATNRKWVVLNSADLVKALPWPSGVEALMQIIAAYRDERSAQWTGRTSRFSGTNAITGEKVDTDIKIMKTDRLEIEELDRAIRYLMNLALELDPNWTLDKPAL